MKTYKDYIKEETDENGILWYWIEQPFFKPSDFKEAIEKNYKHRLKFVTKNELNIENEIEFIKEELTDLQGLIKAKPAYDYEKLSFAQRISGDCWFSDETLNEFKRYFKEYYNYKIKEFQADYLENRRNDLLGTKTVQPEAVKPDEVYKTQNLFKVGLLFATGKMNKYFTLNSNNETVMKVGYSAGKIANELKNGIYNKWILATINNYPTDNVNGNKNVFNSLDMMTKIINHCEAEKIEVAPYFISRLPID